MFWLDIVLVAIVLGCVIFFYSKGFLKSILTLSVAVVSLVLSFICTTYLTPIVSQHFTVKLLDETISKEIENYLPELSEKKLIKDSEIIDDLLLKFNISKESTKFTNSIENGISSLKEYVTQTVCWKITYCVLLLLLWIIIGCILLKLMFVVNIFERLPVIHTLNHFLGAVLGLVFGVIVVWLISLIIFAISPILTEKAPNLFTDNFREKTFVFNYLLNLIEYLPIDF